VARPKKGTEVDFVVGYPPYDCPHQERPDSVLLLVPDGTLPLNENSTHPFYGFYGVFMTAAPERIPNENDVKTKDFI